MKKLVFGSVAIALIAVAPAYADSAPDLAKQKQCFGCHSVDKEVLAPSFKAIARKFSGMKNAQTMLEQIVMKGSDGAAYHWGSMKMPGPGAREPVNQEEATQLVQWILGQQQ